MGQDGRTYTTLDETTKSWAGVPADSQNGMLYLLTPATPSFCCHSAGVCVNRTLRCVSTG